MHSLITSRVRWKMLGTVRPIIGIALGAAMWVLTGSGVLSIIPIDPSKGSFFRILTAFLAGYSEGWARAMLGRIAGHIARDAEPSRVAVKPTLTRR
jgi:hypothetical protein